MARLLMVVDDPLFGVKVLNLDTHTPQMVLVAGYTTELSQRFADSLRMD